MKTTLLAALSSLVLALMPSAVSAAAYYPMPMMGGYQYQQTATSATTSGSDAGEAAGQALLQKLQSGATNCTSLSEGDYASIGDYAMGLMMGASHDAMDQYMTQSLGDSGDRQMHIAMGERFSGCNASAAYPSGFYGFGPMMGAGWSSGMMSLPGQGGWGSGFGGYSMMGFGPGVGYGVLGGIVALLVWVFAIIGVVATVAWLMRRAKK